MRTPPRVYTRGIAVAAQGPRAPLVRAVASPGRTTRQLLLPWVLLLSCLQGQQAPPPRLPLSGSPSRLQAVGTWIRREQENGCACCAQTVPPGGCCRACRSLAGLGQGTEVLPALGPPLGCRSQVPGALGPPGCRREVLWALGHPPPRCRSKVPGALGLLGRRREVLWALDPPPPRLREEGAVGPWSLQTGGRRCCGP